jgi:hypothetical protein
MTVIATLITKHWTVHATDSLITVRNADGSYKIEEQERTKIVRVEAFDGIISYWGLAWDGSGSWNTLEWLTEQCRSAFKYKTPAEFAEHLAQRLTEEISRVQGLPTQDRGLGLHFTAYEYVDGLYVPELFLIRNFLDESYKTLRPNGFESIRRTYPTLFSTSNQQSMEGAAESRKAIHTALQNNSLIRFVNGDPELYVPLANAVFEVFIKMQARKWIKDYSSAAMHRCIARTPIEMTSRLIGGIAPDGVRVVGGTIHDLAVKPGRIYDSSSGD